MKDRTRIFLHDLLSHLFASTDTETESQAAGPWQIRKPRDHMERNKPYTYMILKLRETKNVVKPDKLFLQGQFQSLKTHCKSMSVG